MASLRQRPKNGLAQEGSEYGSSAAKSDETILSSLPSKEQPSVAISPAVSSGAVNGFGQYHDKGTEPVVKKTGLFASLTDPNAVKVVKSGDSVYVDLDGEIVVSDEKHKSAQIPAESRLLPSRPKEGLSKAHQTSGYGTTEDDEHVNGEAATDDKQQPKHKSILASILARATRGPAPVEIRKRQHIAQTKQSSKSKEIIEAIKSLDEAMTEASEKSKGVSSLSDKFRIRTPVETLIKESVLKTRTAADHLKDLVERSSGLKQGQVAAIATRLNSLFKPAAFSQTIADCKFPKLEGSVKIQAKAIESEIGEIRDTVSKSLQSFRF